MLDVYLGVLAALATKELYHEVVDSYHLWRWKKERKDFEIFMEHLEDEAADDDDELCCEDDKK